MSMELLLSQETLQSITNSFLAELYDAAAGKKTSLAFVAQKLAPKPQITDATPFQAIVIGGRTAKSTMVKKENGITQILNSIDSETPIFTSKEMLCTFFEQLLVGDASVVALNFAYPMKPILRDEKVDGILLRATKEHTFDGLINETVGETLEAYIWQKQKRRLAISLANDTVCLVLAGIATTPKDSLIGCVVGSGVNTSMFLDDATIVNIESGNFDKFEPTATGALVDKNSQFIGKYKFEKEVSGAYLFLHFNLLVEQGVVDHAPLSSTRDLSILAQNYDSPAATLAGQLLKRSASFLAAKLAGMYLFKQKKPLTVVTEGSLFWKGYGYKESAKEYLLQLGVPEGHVQFVAIEDSGVIGAAELVS